MFGIKLIDGKGMQSKLLYSTDLVADTATLKDGIWPRSISLWMAAIYMSLFIIRPWEQLLPTLAAFYPERLYAICMLTVVFFSKTKPFRITWQTTTIILFFSAIVFSGIFAYNSSLTWEILYENFSLIVFYFIILMVVQTGYDLIFMVISYVAIMCVYLAKSQWEFFVNGQHRYDMGVVRMVGIENTFGGPNSLAMSIVVSLPFALMLWRHGGIIVKSWPPVWQIRFRRGLILYGILAITSVILTNSRSGLVGLLLYGAMIMFSGKGFARKVKYILSGIIIVSLIWIVVPEENKGRIRTIWAPEEGPANAQVSADGRVEGFKAGMEMFKRHPLTGVGAGNFVPYRMQHLDGVPLQAHNLEGQLLGETGLVGGGAFLLMLLTIFSNCSRTVRLSKRHADDSIIILADIAKACSVSLVLLIFLGTFGHNLYRYNWLWIAAFSLIAFQFVQQKQTRQSLRVP